MTIFERMADDLPFNRRELMLLIVTAPERYKVHMIKKRNDRGLREIAQPTAEVKMIQRWVSSNVISQLPLHEAAVAYRKGGSILAHAKPHAKHRYLLKLDFKDFFPSITADAFAIHLRRYATTLSADDIHIVQRILFRSPDSGANAVLRLSIGAPSSPGVSNSIMFDFDARAHDFCTKHDVAYTRYADDLAFSTNQPRILDEVYRHVQRLLREIRYPSLALNTTKTVNVSRKHHRQLTGVVLTNAGQLSIGRERRRILRAMIDHFAKGQLDDTEVARLRGWIAFARSVDPSIIELVLKRVPTEIVGRLLPVVRKTKDDDTQ